MKPSPSTKSADIIELDTLREPVLAIPQNCAANGLWRDPEVPHFRWECVGLTDAEAEDKLPIGPHGRRRTCQMCGTAIRYVHHLKHPDYPAPIIAGCQCAGRLEGLPDQARHREGEFVKRLMKRERAEKLRAKALKDNLAALQDVWPTTMAGNLRLQFFCPTSDCWHDILIFWHERDEVWKIKWNERWGEQSFASPEEAKARVLERYQRWVAGA